MSSYHALSFQNLLETETKLTQLIQDLKSLQRQNISYQRKEKLMAMHLMDRDERLITISKREHFGLKKYREKIAYMQKMMDDFFGFIEAVGMEYRRFEKCVEMMDRIKIKKRQIDERSFTYRVLKQQESDVGMVQQGPDDGDELKDTTLENGSVWKDGKMLQDGEMMQGGKKKEINSATTRGKISSQENSSHHDISSNDFSTRITPSCGDNFEYVISQQHGKEKVTLNYHSVESGTKINEISVDNQLEKYLEEVAETDNLNELSKVKEKQWESSVDEVLTSRSVLSQDQLCDLLFWEHMDRKIGDEHAQNNEIRGSSLASPRNTNDQNTNELHKTHVINPGTSEIDLLHGDGEVCRNDSEETNLGTEENSKESTLSPVSKKDQSIQTHKRKGITRSVQTKIESKGVSVQAELGSLYTPPMLLSESPKKGKKSWSKDRDSWDSIHFPKSEIDPSTLQRIPSTQNGDQGNNQNGDQGNIRNESSPLRDESKQGEKEHVGESGTQSGIQATGESGTQSIEESETHHCKDSKILKSVENKSVNVSFESVKSLIESDDEEAIPVISSKIHVRINKNLSTNSGEIIKNQQLSTQTESLSLQNSIGINTDPCPDKWKKRYYQISGDIASQKKIVQQKKEEITQLKTVIQNLQQNESFRKAVKQNSPKPNPNVNIWSLAPVNLKKVTRKYVPNENLMRYSSGRAEKVYTPVSSLNEDIIIAPESSTDEDEIEADVTIYEPIGKESPNKRRWSVQSNKMKQSRIRRSSTPDIRRSKSSFGDYRTKSSIGDHRAKTPDSTALIYELQRPLMARRIKKKKKKL